MEMDEQGVYLLKLWTSAEVTDHDNKLVQHQYTHLQPQHNQQTNNELQ
jgi:hypothetical protein